MSDDDLMARAAIYRTATGQITQIFTGPKKLVRFQGGEGLGVVIVGSDVTDETHYVNEVGEVLAKQVLGEFDRTLISVGRGEGAVIRGLPNPTHVRVIRLAVRGSPEETFVVEDGELIITAGVEGAVEVTLFPPVAWRGKKEVIRAA